MTEQAKQEHTQLQSWPSKTSKLAKIAGIIALALTVLWILIRFIETTTHTYLLGNSLVFFLSCAVLIFYVVFIAGVVIKCIFAVRTHYKIVDLCLSWLLFVGFSVSLVFFLFKGFRIASIGLLSTFGGLTASANQSVYCLLKIYPYHPMVPTNAAALFLTGFGIDVLHLSKVLWNTNTLIWAFIWCLLVGLFALIKKSGRKFFTILFLIACASALIFTIHQKSTSQNNYGNMLLHCTADTLLIWQFFVLYSVFRSTAKDKLVCYDGDRSTVQKLLPPKALLLFLFTIFIMPGIANLYNHFILLEKPVFASVLRTNLDRKTMYVVVKRLNVRDGPSIHRPVVGLLKYGDTIPVLEQENDWIKIGKNCWISKKWVQPVAKQPSDLTK